MLRKRGFWLVLLLTCIVGFVQANQDLGCNSCARPVHHDIGCGSCDTSHKVRPIFENLGCNSCERPKHVECNSCVKRPQVMPVENTTCSADICEKTTPCKSAPLFPCRVRCKDATEDTVSSSSQINLEETDCNGVGVSSNWTRPAMPKIMVGPVRACNEIRVLVDTDWPPYVIVETENNKEAYTGIAVDIIKQIANDLNLPITFVAWQNAKDAEYSLEFGDLDVLASSYDSSWSDEIVDLAEPYIKDPLAVLVRSDDPILTRIDQWEDLIGKRGGTTKYFKASKTFAEYSQQYLFIQAFGDLKNTVKMLLDKKFDFMLGSKRQLEYVLSHNIVASEETAIEDPAVPKVELGLKLKLLEIPKLNEEQIYAAFSARGPCDFYRPFTDYKIRQLVKDGEIDKLIRKYMDKEVSDGSLY